MSYEQARQDLAERYAAGELDGEQYEAELGRLEYENGERCSALDRRAEA